MVTDSLGRTVAMAQTEHSTGGLMLVHLLVLKIKLRGKYVDKQEHIHLPLPFLFP